MPNSRYRLRHTRRVRQPFETEQNTSGDDVSDIGANDNEENGVENEDTDTSINSRIEQIQRRYSQTENASGQIGFVERRQTHYRTNEDRINSQDTEQSYPYSDEMALLERHSRNGRHYLNRSATSSNNGVSSRSPENINMANAMEVSECQEFSQCTDEQELPSDVKYMKLQRGITPDFEQKMNKNCSFPGHRRRSSSCDLDITFTRSNENTTERIETRDLKENMCQYFDSVTGAGKHSLHERDSPQYFLNKSLSERDQVVEVTCRSASNSSTFYNIVSYSDKTNKTGENLTVASKDLGYQTNTLEHRNVTKHDVATNTDDSFDLSEFDFPQTESGKVSQNSMASYKMYQISQQSGKTTASSNEFEIPNWRNSKVSTPKGIASGASKFSESSEKGKASVAIDNGLKCHKKDIKDVIEAEFHPVKQKITVIEEGASTSKHICTQTDSQNNHTENVEDNPICLDSRDNVIKAKVDSWQKDWVPACEYKRNENFQIFSKFMHFDQIHAKVQTWKNNWEPSWLKPKEQIDLNTNKDFLKSLKHVGSRIDTGTRNTEGNQWSRYITHKSKIKSAPVNKKKPPCPLGPRRTRD